MTRAGLVFIFFFALLWMAEARQHTRFHPVQLPQNVPSSRILALQQDGKGYLWLMTDRALIRSDGYEVREYPKGFNFVVDGDLLLRSELYFDSKQRPWIIPESMQPEFLDQESGQFISIPDLYSVTSMVEAVPGEFFFGTLSGQLYHWKEEGEVKELILAKPNQELIKLFGDPRNPDLVFLLFKDELGVIHTTTHEYEPKLTLPKSSAVKFSTAYINPEGKLWLGTFGHGVVEFIGEGQFLPWKDKNASDAIKSPVLQLLEDKSKNLWVATFDSGLYVRSYKTSRLAHHYHRKSNFRTLPGNVISSLLEDQSGILWVGSFGGGLSYHDAYLDQFQVISNQDTPEGIALENIQGLYVDSKSRIWVGTGGNGLLTFNPRTKSWQSYGSSAQRSEDKINSSKWITSIQGWDNELWISYARGGIARYNTNSGEWEYFGEGREPELSLDRVSKIFPADSSRVWLSSSQGELTLFDPQEGVVRRLQIAGNQKGFQSGNHISDLISVNKSEMWLGTSGRGLLRVDPMRGDYAQFIPEPPGADPHGSRCEITALIYRQDKTIWVGTKGCGLWVFDTTREAWKSIPELDVWKGSSIFGLSEDLRGNVWVISGEGIFSVGFTQSGKTVLQAHPVYPSGFVSSDLTFFHDRLKGGMYVGAGDQILFFDEEEVRPKDPSTRVLLTRVTSGEFDLKTGDSAVSEVPHNELNFYFSALAFSSPEQSHYQFRLKGLEENWRTQQGTNWVSYINLAPGEYIFEIRASTIDGVWSQVEQNGPFRIPPPWYATWTAKLLFGLVLVLLGLLVYRYLNFRLLMKVKLDLKDQEMQRLQELDQLKSAFFGNISHEFRTPLALIVGPAERMLDRSEDLHDRSQLRLVLENARKLVALTDRIFSVRSVAQEKSSSLQIVNGNLSLLLQSILVNFSYICVQKEVRIRSRIPLITEVWFDTDKVERIIENAVYLAIEFVRTKECIDFEANLQGHVVQIKLSFQTAQSKVRFFNPEVAKQDAHAEPSDLVLKWRLLEKLVAIHQGTFQGKIESGEAVLQLAFSVDKYSYPPSQVVEEEDQTETQLQEDGGPEVKMESNAPKILIVEDNKSLRDFLARELGKTYEIIQAENGKMGLYEAKKSNPDLILSDIMMPEMDGFELCEALKSNELTSHIPIILLTAKTEEESQIHALELGIDDYIHKPFSFQKLALRIEKIIDLRNKLRLRYAHSIHIAPSDIEASSMDEKLLREIQALVDSDMMECDFTIDKFSKALGMSRMQLHRKLTALIGLSASAFIRDQRLRKAIQKLDKTDETIAEIAYSVGFSSPSYFIKCFKESYKITPMEYKKEKTQG
ncbi:hybrid sensor histidine kinase/response regulator transcription factor [Algoriphagus namhaensis]